MHQSVPFNSRFSKLLAAAVLVAGLVLGAMSAGAQTIQVDPNLDMYSRTGGVSGNLNSIGSDTLLNLMTFWSESFRKVYPNVKVQIEGKGSSTAPPALTEGTSQLGPMSRTMKDKELQGFEKRHGYKPTRIGVALDSLAVFVNKDNPIKGMTLPQVDAVFSANRKLGHSTDVTTWGQLGLGGSWANLPISLYGRNSASGTYGFFKEEALGKGDYKNSVKEQPGSSAVVQGVTADRTAIGYSGIGYKTSGVRAIPLAEKENGTMYEPNYDNVLSGKYPLGRMLYVYVDKAPNKPLNPLVREFMTFVLSKEGQEIVVKDGYLPLPASVAKKQLSMLQ